MLFLEELDDNDLFKKEFLEHLEAHETVPVDVNDTPC